jgi:hypothetical protein
MIKDLKELEKLFKLCRKHGVYEGSFFGHSFKMGESPQDPGSKSEVISDPYANFPAGELTPEQLMYYSAGGAPEDDPTLKANA